MPKPHVGGVRVGAELDFVERLKSQLNKAPAPDRPTELIYIYLPQDLDPEVRHYQYADPLDVELKLAGLGFVSGGGSFLSEEDDDGARAVEFCGVDVDATDVAAARDLLRRHLPALGCPRGTQLHYRDRGASFQDEYDGVCWVMGRPRDLLIPGF